MSIFDYFPFDEIRKPQEESLRWAEESDAKYLLLESPVGSGKSAIGVCLSAYLSDTGNGNSFILTPQRILQEQYERSFDAGKLASLYGKSNYKCRNKKTTCDIGGLVKPKCPSCPYRSAVGRAKYSPNVVMNYKLALLIFSFTNLFDPKNPRSLMILDECHTLEEHLTEFNAVSFNFRRTKRYGIEKDWPEVNKLDFFGAIEWVMNTYLPAAERYFVELSEEIRPLLMNDEYTDIELTREDVRKIKEFDALEDHITGIKDFFELDPQVIAKDFVFVPEKSSFKFKMLYAQNNFHDILDPFADKFLMMSSTILNKTGFCKDLGLPPDQTDFLSVGSEFPPEKRPVIFIPNMKMNASWSDRGREKEREEMSKAMKTIILQHKGESGIIHTGNFKIADWLMEEFWTWPEAAHEFFEHGDAKTDRNTVIKSFIDSGVPSILISPSSTEGLDLVDDLARFAIFAKIPFGYLGDNWIKRRMQLSKEWYQRRALIDVIQGGGRVVRSKDDWGSVYILDGSWGFLFSQTQRMIPPWWKEAYSTIG